MKKIFLFVIAIILIIPNISFATSGACSSHGGVDCSSGPAYGGKVMCNDGWVNSSVSFSSAQECNTQEADILEIDYEISRIDSQISQLEISRNQAVANQTEFLAHIGALRTDGNAQGGLNAVSQKYQSQIDLLNIDKNYLNKLKKQLKDELNQIKDTEALQQEEIDKKNQEISNNIDKIIENIPKLKQESCIKDLGVNSKWDGVVKDDGTFDCVCLDGFYIDKNNKCNTALNVCIEKFGPNAYPVKDRCSCTNGYIFNKESNTCKKNINKISPPKTIIALPPTVNNSNTRTNIYSSLIPPSNLVKENTSPEPIIKLKWYQKIFNWFKKN